MAEFDDILARARQQERDAQAKRAADEAQRRREADRIGVARKRTFEFARYAAKTLTTHRVQRDGIHVNYSVSESYGLLRRTRMVSVRELAADGWVVNRHDAGFEERTDPYYIVLTPDGRIVGVHDQFSKVEIYPYASEQWGRMHGDFVRPSMMDAAVQEAIARLLARHGLA